MQIGGIVNGVNKYNYIVQRILRKNYTNFGKTMVILKQIQKRGTKITLYSYQHQNCYRNFGDIGHCLNGSS